MKRLREGKIQREISWFGALVILQPGWMDVGAVVWQLLKMMVGMLENEIPNYSSGSM